MYGIVSIRKILKDKSILSKTKLKKECGKCYIGIMEPTLFNLRVINISPDRLAIRINKVFYFNKCNAYLSSKCINSNNIVIFEKNIKLSPQIYTDEKCIYVKLNIKNAQQYCDEYFVCLNICKLLFNIINFRTSTSRYNNKFAYFTELPRKFN